MGNLYIVSTPIGNLEDMTLRAIRILGEVDRVACEDTRRTKTLLRNYGIRTRTLSYRDHNKVTAARKIFGIIEGGGDVALVSDAGTPTISDPGLYLIRAAIEKEIPVIPLPGASIVLTALVVSGLTTVPFSVFGFLPQSPRGVRRLCEELTKRSETLLFFDSPKRLARDLSIMREIWSERRAVVAREVTKVHEEFKRGTLEALAEYYGESFGAGVRGEVVILVEGSREGSEKMDADVAEIVRYIRFRFDEEELTARDMTREVVETFGITRNRAYPLVVAEMKKTREGRG
jgi:16S rRNA (cytidine1402-2'-O)-methyltransferase